MAQAEEQVLFRQVKMLLLLLISPMPRPGASYATADLRPDGHGLYQHQQRHLSVGSTVRRQ